MNLQYTINSIGSDGTVKVTFAYDGKQQSLSGMPTEDSGLLKASLSEYVHAYIAGKELEAVSIPGDVTALVGQKIEG
ncbi:MAG TPA: hypothetical protein VJ841_03590 [Candidatus Saccharimonadales bacterium]|nr:hypothetical protein [Candidatus Saccharimonadales bacterium]